MKEPARRCGDLLAEFAARCLRIAPRHDYDAMKPLGDLLTESSEAAALMFDELAALE